jgi:hypothetical protein
MGYRWSASRITKADMIRLCEGRQTGEPITQLLRERVLPYPDGGSKRRWSAIDSPAQRTSQCANHVAGAL